MGCSVRLLFTGKTKKKKFFSCIFQKMSSSNWRKERNRNREILIFTFSFFFSFCKVAKKMLIIKNSREPITTDPHTHTHTWWWYCVYGHFPLAILADRTQYFYSRHTTTTSGKKKRKKHNLVIVCVCITHGIVKCLPVCLSVGVWTRRFCWHALTISNTGDYRRKNAGYILSSWTTQQRYTLWPLTIKRTRSEASLSLSIFLSFFQQNFIFHLQSKRKPRSGFL